MTERFIPKAIFSHADDLAREIKKPVSLPDEYTFVRLFLLSYSHSQDTYNTYRREIERFCQWVWFIEKKAISAITRHQVLAYVKFFQSPPAGWVATRHHPRKLESYQGTESNAEWRPFVVKVGKKRVVSQAGMKSMLACLSTFYTFLIHEGHVVQNPVQMLNQKKQLLQSVQSHRVKRRLSQKQ